MKRRQLKRILIVITCIAAGFFLYVAIINQNSKDMTYRQQVLKAVYPLWMWWAKITGTNTQKLANEKTIPPVDFHSLQDTLIDGSPFSFDRLKGKKVLLVNTASDCGYTNQYDDLEKLYREFENKLVIIGFPANDFKEQEKGDDASIASFCRKNYGVSFPLMRKSVVITKQGQNPVYQWLTDPDKNGWNRQAPTWNFSKYLVDENGVLTNFFGPTVRPYDREMIDAISK